MADVNSSENQRELPSTAEMGEAHNAHRTALKAHQDALARYKSLEAEIGLIISAHAARNAKVTEAKQATIAHYVPFLQQQEVSRKVNVIASAYSSVSTNNSPIAVSVEDFTRTRAGEIPTVPTTPAQPAAQSITIESRLSELKKAVLSAKQTVEMHDRTPSSGGSNGVTRSDLSAQVYGLQQARNALITWIEERLGIVGEAQAANAHVPASLCVVGEEPPIPVTTNEISQIYDQYINARHSLLQVLQYPEAYSSSQLSSIPQTSRAPDLGRLSDNSGALSASILPYVASLISLKHSDSAAKQHSAFMEEQLGKAQAETTELIRRLADESHLVHRGADHGRAWTHASKKALKEVTDTVASRAEEGLGRLAEAEDSLESMSKLSVLFSAST